MRPACVLQNTDASWASPSAGMWLIFGSVQRTIQLISSFGTWQIQLRASDIKEISSYSFFSFLLLVFIPCSHSSIHGSNFSARWCWAKALLICALPTSENTSCRASAGSSGCKHLLAFCKKYTSLHLPTYTTNLNDRWERWERLIRLEQRGNSTQRELK